MSSWETVDPLRIEADWVDDLPNPTLPQINSHLNAKDLSPEHIGKHPGLAKWA
jgi:hypothetical protein